MTHEITDLTAALFKNDYKEKDSQPDYVGKVSTKDKEPAYRISAWLNESKSGKTYMSIRFSDLPDQKPKVESDPFEGGNDVPF